MTTEWRVFTALSKNTWSGSYTQAIEEFMNEPSNYAGWELVQVINVWSGGADLLFKKTTK